MVVEAMAVAEMAAVAAMVAAETVVVVVAMFQIRAAEISRIVTH